MSIEWPRYNGLDMDDRSSQDNLARLAGICVPSRK